MALPPPPKSSFKARLGERRRLLEQVRTVSVSRVRADLDKIVQREAAYAQRLLQELLPLRLVWNEDAAAACDKALSKAMPFRIEFTDPLEDGLKVSSPPGRAAADEEDGDVVDKPIA